VRLLVILASAVFALGAAQSAAQGLQPGILPTAPRVEHTLFGAAYNFDILVQAPPDRSVSIASIEVGYLDAAGRTLYERTLDFNGRGIDTVPNRTLRAGQRRLLLNPFPIAPPDVSPARVRVRVGLYEAPEPPDPAQMRLVQTQEFTASIAPEPQPLRLIMPLAGRVLVWDGHDLTSHHRRFDYIALERFGYRANADRYSYDFVVVDGENRMKVGEGDANERYLGYRHPIRAPADGVVVEARDDRPDDRRMDMQAVRQNLNATSGNYLVIDHGQRRFSLLAHIHTGSLKVKVGDSVRAGQEVAAVGASGSSLFPHLHYELIDNSNTGVAEGLPSYFQDIVRVRGGTTVPVGGVSIDSGDVVLAK